ncbi:hypothetical protein ILUMI_11558 [Ignelater luminosus]|uniref:Uncharacterized protein n=1 Tax=Ignelater luminosus TaxID=2038154 RepID=A0A8K0G7L6_IGNLU|nr:hypothetical protein ILUMI_11558 [Ignelater luminosus]
MFKFYIAAVCIFLLVNLQGSLSNQDDDLETTLEAFFRRRCSQTALQNLEQAYKTWTSGIVHTILIHEAKTFEEYWNLFCNDMRSKIYSSLATVLEKLEPCLPPEENFIPDFVSGWYNNSYDELCTDGNETTIGYIGVMMFGPSCKKLVGQNGDELSEKCYSESSVKKDLQSDNFVIKKNSLCLYLEHGSECFLDFLNGDCNDMYQFFRIVFTGMKKWCDINVDE